MSCALAISNNQLLAIAGILVLIAVSMRMLVRRRREPGPTPQDYARRQVARLKEQHDMGSDIQSLMVQLQELSRAINAQIDTKFAKLESSIRAADERICALQRLCGDRVGPGLDVTVQDHRGPADLDRDADPQPEDAGHQRIYQLADAGKSAVQIAQATGQSPGEVELILSLRKGLH